jgi:hypothetical protein
MIKKAANAAFAIICFNFLKSEKFGLLTKLKFQKTNFANILHIILIICTFVPNIIFLFIT